MKKFVLILSVISLIISCDEGDDAVTPTTPTAANNNNNDTSNTNNPTALNNSYIFSDDNVECFPHTSNPSINGNGILSIVSMPCSNSGSKLDGYFKWNSRPLPGTYKIVGKIGSIPNTPAMNQDEFSIVFYGHGQSALYSTAGTVELTKNTTDSAKLDLNWKDVEMSYGHDSSTVKFSGNLQGL